MWTVCLCILAFGLGLLVGHFPNEAGLFLSTIFKRLTARFRKQPPPPQ